MRFIIASMIFLSSVSSFAQAVPNTRVWRDVKGAFDWQIANARQDLAAIGAQGAATSRTCEQFYSRVFNDRVLTISLAFGYFDISEGEDHVAFTSNVGENFVSDSIAKAAMVEALTRKCDYKGVMACSFKKKSENRLERVIKTRYGGDVRVVINITNGSYSTSDVANKGKYKAQQAQQTAIAEQNFFGGIRNGNDAVIYMGHARSGGGPDFTPPVLLKNGKPNYGWYKQNRPGFGKMMSAINHAGNKPEVIALLACRTTSLFAGSVQNAARNTMVVSAGDLFEDADFYATGFAMVDNLMAERCGAQFNAGLKVSKNAARFLRINFVP